MNCQQAKAIDLVSYLADLGHFPKRKTKDGYWYLSPLRQEKTPSFKVHPTNNIYYDHGGDQGGGTIIDFGKAYHNCTTSELLRKLETFVRHNPQAYDRNFIAVQIFEPIKQEKKIEIVETREIASPALVGYLQTRKIPFKLANRFLCEAKYTLYGRYYYALAFKNNAGGYELRNPFFKGSCMPKAYTFFDRGFDEVEVMEGGFSFLSFLVVYGDWEKLESNFLILNSTTQFHKSRIILEKHKKINLHLDNDKTGINLTIKSLGYGPQYRNVADSYWGFKDWNEYLVDHYLSKRNNKTIFRISRSIILQRIHLPLKRKPSSITSESIKNAA